MELTESSVVSLGVEHATRERDYRRIIMLAMRRSGVWRRSERLGFVVFVEKMADLEFIFAKIGGKFARIRICYIEFKSRIFFFFILQLLLFSNYTLRFSNRNSGINGW